MNGSERGSDTEHDKTAALHEIAEEVQHEREGHGHSLLDGEHVVGNREDDSEADESATLPGDVESIPPAMPSGN